MVKLRRFLLPVQQAYRRISSAERRERAPRVLFRLLQTFRGFLPRIDPGLRPRMETSA